MAETRRYEIAEGKHYEPRRDIPHREATSIENIKCFSKGEVFESDDPNLMRRFPNKFREIIERNKPEVTEARKGSVSMLIQSGTWGEDDRTFLEELSEENFSRLMKKIPIGLKELPDETRKVKSPLGEDVTDLFQRAYDEGYKVFRNAAGKHQITKGRSKPLNPEPLDANQVESFIEAYSKEK